MSRKGYALKAPCQDVLDFLRRHAPASQAERTILDYKYVTRAPQDFVMRTQIMNEGWAMYWEKKIMMELFKERAVNGIIDYSRVFSNVCRPRPYFQRNPYHLGYNLWCHIEQLYRDGKVSLDYHEEIDLEKKHAWRQKGTGDPIEAMGHLVDTVTDYEFLRRFLTPELIHELQLNRIDRRTAERLGIKEQDLVYRDERYVWLQPEPIKDEMLRFYTHFYRPRIYVIDTDFQDGGLLLFHRDDGRALRKDWIRPTLRNLNLIWKAPVALVSKDQLFAVTGNQYKSEEVKPVVFEQVVERMRRGEKPFRALELMRSGGLPTTEEITLVEKGKKDGSSELSRRKPSEEPEVLRVHRRLHGGPDGVPPHQLHAHLRGHQELRLRDRGAERRAGGQLQRLQGSLLRRHQRGLRAGVLHQADRRRDRVGGEGIEPPAGDRSRGSSGLGEDQHRRPGEPRARGVLEARGDQALLVLLPLREQRPGRRVPAEVPAQPDSALPDEPPERRRARPTRDRTSSSS